MKEKEEEEVVSHHLFFVSFGILDILNYFDDYQLTDV